MNELIEQLTGKFETECHLSFDCIEEEKFAHAIQTACKAQRNACARVYADNLFDDTYTAIANAEIRRKDYENN